jgi:hypothetical protein
MDKANFQIQRTLVFAAIVLAIFIKPAGAQTPTPTATATPTSTPAPTPTATATATSAPSGTPLPPPSSSAATSPGPTATPEIKLVSPKVTYPAKGAKHYELWVVGSNFGKQPDETNTQGSFIYLNDNIVQPFKWIDNEKQVSDAKTAYGQVSNGNQVHVWLPWPTYSGVLSLKLGIQDKVSNALDGIVVSKIESKWKAAWLAAGITLALLGLPLFLVSRNSGSAYHIGDQQYGVLAAFFLDKETDTYSLSKFQFYLWTAVAIFGYVYLALVESLVQGKAVFPEIPENLPGIILVSAATSVLATGITAARGPKGAGDIHPSLGDFVSAGGVVVAERFQFFVWTLLGAVTFLFFTISSDPATLHDLPKIPDSFLQIMGISSLGYLSGKLARKPGPVIDNIQPDPTTAAGVTTNFKLTVAGQKLSQDAALRIGADDVKIVTTPAGGTAVAPPLEVGSAKLNGFTKEEQGDFCKQLIFEINPKPEWKTKDKHKVTLTNDDGKAASWDYELT